MWWPTCRVQNYARDQLSTRNRGCAATCDSGGRGTGTGA